MATSARRTSCSPRPASRSSPTSGWPGYVAGRSGSIGTPAYLDPVVAAGGAAGAASDVFALGAVALHALTGAGPWQRPGEPAASAEQVLAVAATGQIDRVGRPAGRGQPGTCRRAGQDPEPGAAPARHRRRVRAGPAGCAASGAGSAGRRPDPVQGRPAFGRAARAGGGCASRPARTGRPDWRCWTGRPRWPDWRCWTGWTAECRRWVRARRVDPHRPASGARGDRADNYWRLGPRSATDDKQVAAPDSQDPVAGYR